ncbi:MAG: tetratricopeptide repeat protein [Pelobacteraceae bacterium]
MKQIRTMMISGFLLLAALPAFSADYIADCNKYFEKGDYDLAVTSGRKAVDAYNRNVDAHFCLAEAWRMQGELRLALSEMKVADSLVQDNDYLALRLALKEVTDEQYQKIQKELYLKISNRLGIILGGMRNYSYAVTEFQRSISLASELGNKDEKASAYARLAATHSAMGEYEKSLEDFREALKLTSRDSEISSLYNNMAVVFGNMGDFPTAEEYFAKSLALDEKIGDKRAQAIHLLNQGMTKQAQKDFAGAAVIFSKSRLLSRDIKDAYWEGVANRQFGDMYRLLGNVRRARLSYAGARERFVAAHAIGDVKSMDSVIDDLTEQQPVAGIEINSSDITSLLIAARTDQQGHIDFKEILRQSYGPITLVTKEGEALSPEGIDSIAAGVAAAGKMLLEERKLDRSVVSIVVSGLPASASNREALSNRIIQASGIVPVFVTPGAMKRYDFSGRVASGKETNALLLTISGDDTAIAALDSKGEVVSAKIQQGAFTAVRKQEKKPRLIAEKTIKGEQAALLRQTVKGSVPFSTKKTVCLEGDVARVVAVFAHPDTDGNLVKITIADLDRFVTAVKKKSNSYFNPNISKIKNSGAQEWAVREIDWVKRTFVPGELMAGVQYLKMVMGVLKVKEAYVSRNGNWVAGRMYESTRMSDKLEAGMK